MPWHGSKLSQTPADQHVPVPASSITPTGAVDPAPTRRDSRAISLTTTSPNNRNGPPKKPTDRHERSRLGGEGWEEAVQNGVVFLEHHPPHVAQFAS